MSLLTLRSDLTKKRLLPHNSTNMRRFGTEINGNRAEKAELFHETRSARFIRLTKRDIAF
jgi:hypothetical protein